MNLKATFKKQGGVKLLKQYWKGGALFTAMGEFLLLGKSRTALEILRLSTQLKVKQKLEKKYTAKLDEFEKNYDPEQPHKTSNKVWICWFQGMENAPTMVQKCYQSLQENLNGREIILITEENMKKYVQFPSYIQEKVDKGIISKTHLSDLLRLELLIRYGGTWIDSTVYCSGGNIPEYMLEADLFLFQNLKPGRDGHTTVISNWFITATSNNKLLVATRELLYQYWKQENEVVDYFVFHDFFQMVIEKYPAEWKKVVPFSNSTPHILLLRLEEPYDGKVWQAIKAQTPFHKLTYKFDTERIEKKGTYYDVLFKEKTK